MGIRYLDEQAGTATPLAQTPARIRYLDEPQPQPRGLINPYGLPRWQDRRLTSKLLPPFSPLQMAFTPQAERFGERMAAGAQAAGRVPGNIAEAMIGRPQPRINPPGVFPRVQIPSDREIAARSFIPAALDALVGGPAEVAASLLGPRNLGMMLATGPAFEAATASRLANVPLRRISSELFRGPTTEELFMKAIRPSVSGKKTAAGARQYQQRAETAVKTIADFRSELALPDAAGNLVPRLPESLKDMSQAIEQTKFAVFRRYDALARETSRQGVRVPTRSAAEAAAEVKSNKVINRYYPEIASYARTWEARLRRSRSHTPEEVQDLVAKMNADLEAYYRSPQPGSAAKAVIDAGIANNLRRSLDAQIEQATGGQYQLLKNLYGSLKTIEKDVNHRMVVFARQNKKGLVDFSDIFSGAEMVRGITSLNPSTFATGVAAKLIASYYKYINNPDQMVKRMFRRVASRSSAPPQDYPGIYTRAARRATPAIKGVSERLPKGEGGFVALPGAEAAANVPTFFSQAERLIEQRMPNAAPATHVQGILRGGGLKQDELNWLDLDSFLKDKPKVTKQEVLDYVRANNVQVQEVVKGKAPALASPEQQLLEDLERRLLTLNEQESELLGQLRTKAGDYGGTKFAAYQLPGGTNYRELLLTVPRRENLVVSFAKPNAQKGGWTVNYSDGTSANFLRVKSLDEAVAAGNAQIDAGLKTQGQDFRSSHFDEPNVLAHIRFNDRVDARGKKVLFIEEVQSDWHQKGRKQGYKGGEPYPTDYIEPYRQEMMEQPKFKSARPTDQEVISYFDLKPKGEVGGVPNAPFKKTWHELTLKRMLRWAAENKYDKLAWTTGEQQAARYDLSKQIRRIEWTRQSRGGEQVYFIKAYPHEGRTAIPVIDEGNIRPNELDSYVGKELANRINADVENPGGYLSGLDLKVGGEGMKGFYDKILPDFLNRYAKKWGGKVSETRIPEVGDYPVTSVGDVQRRARLERTLRRENPNFLTVHSLDLTPAMKYSVMKEGQPLFQVGAGIGTAGLTYQGMTQQEPQTDEEALLAKR